MSASGESELMVNWNIFTSAEQAIATVLVSAGQSHLFSGWPEPGNFDEDKRRLMAQAIDLDQKCPGGIEGYCTRARDLLEASRMGSNPYQGFKPSVPLGQSLETQSAEGQEEFDRLEAKGMSEMAGTAFVLVAGGLGERLGYDGIKVELPAEITTETCYLDLYCQHILALQARARVQSGDDSITLPLAIMTSGDTDTQTRALLEAHSNFGMAEGQLTVVMQELVPALLDNAAHMATSEDDPFLIETKPHGHGDVHLLLHQSGLASKWAASGVKWVLFFQDTNGLVFRAAPAAIGVSAERNLAVNSLTVPRKPGEAVGAICRLEGENGKCKPVHFLPRNHNTCSHRWTHCDCDLCRFYRCLDDHQCRIQPAGRAHDGLGHDRRL
jgi:UDP-sugar pyrophosphorylase